MRRPSHNTSRPPNENSSRSYSKPTGTVVRGLRLTEDVHAGTFKHETELSVDMRGTALWGNGLEFILEFIEL